MKTEIIKKLVRLFVFSFIFLQLFTNKGVAQYDLRKDSSFFSLKWSETEYWLSESGLGQLFKLSDMQIKRNKLILNFESTFQSGDSASTAWRLMQMQYDSTENEAFAKNFFNAIAFEMELGKDSLQINLGTNLKDFKVSMHFNSRKGVIVKESIVPPNRTFKSLIIRFDELDMPGGTAKTTVDKLTIKEIRKRISAFLKTYFKARGTFWYDSQLDILKDNYNELTFEVTKLSKEILSDRNYFEYIRIEIKIQKKNKDIEVRYQIQGKYSGGFGFAPRRSEYRNMEPDYADYLIRYEEKVAQEINQLLTK